MTEGTHSSICILANDQSLAKALAEQPRVRGRWAIIHGGTDCSPQPEIPQLVLAVDLAPEALDVSVRDLRTRGYSGPVAVLSRESWPDLLDIAVIPSPIRLGALLYWIEATLRAASGTHQLGPYEFRSQERQLRHGSDGQAIRLTELECRLLGVLLAARGALVSREALLADVWGYSSEADTHTVETHIWRLRQKIETDDPETRILVTDAGAYRLALAESPSRA